MTAVPFDTLWFARRLEDAGLATSVAAGASEALAEALTGVELATRSDIATARADLGRDIERTRTELKTDIELLRRDVTIRLGSMMLVGIGILLAAIRYLPAHP